MPTDFELAYQELLDSGASPEEAELDARRFTTPATDTALLGNFIGDPENPESNQFRQATGWHAPQRIGAAPAQSEWSPWNSPVQPAGMAFNLAGPNPDTVSQWIEAYGQDVANKVLVAPAQEREIVVGSLRGLRGDAPDEKIEAIDAGFKDAINRLAALVKEGMAVEKADLLLLEPLRGAAKSLANEYRYRKANQKEPLIPWKLNYDLSSGKEAEVKLTPTAFVEQFPSLPDYAKTNMVNLAQLRGFGFNPPAVAGAEEEVPISTKVVIMRNPQGQSVKVNQSQVARARQLGYR